jgi:hypothetical protein
MNSEAPCRIGGAFSSWTGFRDENPGVMTGDSMRAAAVARRATGNDPEHHVI